MLTGVGDRKPRLGRQPLDGAFASALIRAQKALDNLTLEGDEAIGVMRGSTTMIRAPRSRACHT